MMGCKIKRRFSCTFCAGSNMPTIYIAFPVTPILMELIQSAVRKRERLTGVNLLAPRVHTPQPSVKVALTDVTQARTNTKSPTVTNHQRQDYAWPTLGGNFGPRILGYRWSRGGGQVTRVELPLSTSASCGSLLAGGCRSRTLQADARTNPGNTRLAGHTDAVQMSTGLLHNSPLQDDPRHRQLLVAASWALHTTLHCRQPLSFAQPIKQQCRAVGGLDKNISYRIWFP